MASYCRILLFTPLKATTPHSNHLLLPNVPNVAMQLAFLPPNSLRLILVHFTILLLTILPNHLNCSSHSIYYLEVVHFLLLFWANNPKFQLIAVHPRQSNDFASEHNSITLS